MAEDCRASLGTKTLSLRLAGRQGSEVMDIQVLDPSSGAYIQPDLVDPAPGQVLVPAPTGEVMGILAILRQLAQDCGGRRGNLQTLGAGLLLPLVLLDGGVALIEERSSIPAQSQDLGDPSPAEGGDSDSGEGPEGVGTLGLHFFEGLADGVQFLLPDVPSTGRFRIPLHASAGVHSIRPHSPDFDRKGKHGREGGQGPIGCNGEGNRIVPDLDLVCGQVPDSQPAQLWEDVHVQCAPVALLSAGAQLGHDLHPVLLGQAGDGLAFHDLILDLLGGVHPDIHLAAEDPGLLLGPVERQGVIFADLEPLLLGGPATHAVDEPPGFRSGLGDPEDQAGGLGVRVVLAFCLRPDLIEFILIESHSKNSSEKKPPA